MAEHKQKHESDIQVIQSSFGVLKDHLLDYMRDLDRIIESDQPEMWMCDNISIL